MTDREKSLEDDLANMREEVYALRAQVRDLEGQVVRAEAVAVRPGAAAKFRLRDIRVDGQRYAIPFLDPMSDRIELRWKRPAYGLPGVYGRAAVVDGEWVAALPTSLVAQSWWHLCAILGTSEGIARVFYHHPEEDQESAVSAATSARPRLSIYCQGDDEP